MGFMKPNESLPAACNSDTGYRTTKPYRAIVRNILRDIHWFIRGATIANPPLCSGPDTILFVCMGNICRSPFAHQFAKTIPTDRPIHIDSAGLRVDKARPSPANAVAAAARLGIDLSRNKSKPVSREMLASSDLVLVMEHWQTRELARRFPDQSGKVHLLSLYIPFTPGTSFYDRFNIKDPFNQDLSVFIQSFQRIQLALFSLSKALDGSSAHPPDRLL